MSEDGILVESGDIVTAGQIIAKIGNEGKSTGPHLHFSIIQPETIDQDWFYGTFIDPVEFLETRNVMIDQ